MFSGRFMAWAAGFFLLAILAAALGASENINIPMPVARIFVVIFLVLANVALIL